jgi:hypothetical protein
MGAARILPVLNQTNNLHVFNVLMRHLLGFKIEIFRVCADKQKRGWHRLPSLSLPTQKRFLTGSVENFDV